MSRRVEKGQGRAAMLAQRQEKCWYRHQHVVVIWHLATIARRLSVIWVAMIHTVNTVYESNTWQGWRIHIGRMNDTCMTTLVTTIDQFYCNTTHDSCFYTREIVLRQELCSNLVTLDTANIWYRLDIGPMLASIGLVSSHHHVRSVTSPLVMYSPSVIQSPAWIAMRFCWWRRYISTQYNKGWVE